MKINQLSLNNYLESKTNQYAQASTKEFEVALKQKHYEATLKTILESMTKEEQLVHLKTMRLLREKGFNKVELLIINSILLTQKDELTLSKNDKELFETYQNTLLEVQKAIKKRRELELILKPLETRIEQIDTILKAKSSIQEVEVSHTVDLNTKRG